MIDLQKGKIKFFNQAKSYGFIVPEDADGDIFIHMTELEKSGYKGINIGQRVSYELGTNHKGKQQAVNIKII
jgi:CspA family cold shock protein